MSVDSGMLVVITIIAMYMTLVFGLLFYVKNEWCDILHHNLTVTQSQELYWCLPRYQYISVYQDKWGDWWVTLTTRTLLLIYFKISHFSEL